MKIIFSNFDSLGHPTYNGGGALAIHEVASKLAQEHEVEIVCGNYAGAKNEKLDCVQYTRIGSTRLNPRINQLLYSVLLPFVVMTKQFDIWFESFTPPFTTGFLPLFTKRPVIGISHGLFGKELAKKYKLPFQVIEQFGLKFYRHIVTPTQENKLSIQKFVDHKKTQIHVISNGITVPKFDKKTRVQPPEKDYFLYLGRIDIEQKGLDLLVEAYAALNDNTLPTLLIAGEGTQQDKDQLITQIKHHHLEKKIRLIGRVNGSEKHVIIEQARALLMPSRFEIQGISLLEALYYQKAIVCFDIPGFHWLKGYDGVWMVKPFNISDFSKQIKKLSQEPFAKIQKIPHGIQVKTWDEISKMYNELLTTFAV